MWRKWLLELFGSKGGKQAINESMQNLTNASKIKRGQQLDLFNNPKYSNVQLPDGRNAAKKWLLNNPNYKSLKGTDADFEVSWKKFLEKKGLLNKKPFGGSNQILPGMYDQRTVERGPTDTSYIPGMKKGGQLKKDKDGRFYR